MPMRGALLLFPAAITAALLVARVSGTCYQEPGFPSGGLFGSCTCHPTCGDCGWDTAPTGSNQCLTCAQPGAYLTNQASDGQGTCACQLPACDNTTRGSGALRATAARPAVALLVAAVAAAGSRQAVPALPLLGLVLLAPSSSQEAGATVAWTRGDDDAKNCTPATFGAVPLPADPVPCDQSVDSTPAFELALRWCHTRSVLPPPGSYRLDSTLMLSNGRALHVPIGSSLRRTNCSTSSQPVVTVGEQALLTGFGSISSENPSPRGVVSIGPSCTGWINGTLHKTQCLANVVFGMVEGVRISGHNKFTHFDANPSWSPNATAGSGVALEQCGGWIGQQASFGPEGSVGLCLESSQWNIHDGCTYLNTVRDVMISGVDVGMCPFLSCRPSFPAALFGVVTGCHVLI